MSFFDIFRVSSTKQENEDLKKQISQLNDSSQEYSQQQSLHVGMKQ